MKLKHSYSNDKLTKFARLNRKNPTKAENKFWQSVRSRRFLGYKFRRQVPISKYIADFYSEDLKLVVEIDGSSHNESTFENDRQRQNVLEDLGLNVLRFSEFNVIENFDDIAKTLEVFIDEFTSSASR